MPIYWLTIRQLLVGKRWLVLCLLAAVPWLLAAIDAARSAEPSFWSEGFPVIVLGMTVPLIPLLLAGSAISADIEEGTAVYLLAKPISRTRIVLERYAAAVSVALALVFTSLGVSALIQRPPADAGGSLLLGYLAAATLGTLVYTILFLALSLVTRRGLLLGLLYIIVWERVFAGQFAGTRFFRVFEYMAAVASSLDRSGLAPSNSGPPTQTALILAGAIAGLAAILAIHRLRNYEVADRG